MAEFMMLMKSPGGDGDWPSYINQLVESGKFRGGSVLSNGQCVSKAGTHDQCSVVGYMRFEAESIDEVMALVKGNPVYEAGGDIEILEAVVT